MSVNKIIMGLALSTAFAAAPALAAEGPYTQAQLDKGKSEYNTHCRTCHAAAGKGALGPALQGPTFKARFGGQTVAEIRRWTHENMPQTAPGSLNDDQLNVLMAYILSLNGYTPGQTELTADSAKSVTFEK